jgi:hypothetical protein
MFYFRHGDTPANIDDSKANNRVPKRNSAPPPSKQSKNSYRSPFSTPSPTAVLAATKENGSVENQSDEYEMPRKVK